MVNLPLRNCIPRFYNCSSECCIILLTFAPLTELRTVFLKPGFPKNSLDNVCGMDWSVILHKDLAWLPARWDRFFKYLEVRVARETLLRRGLISHHHHDIGTASNPDRTPYHNAYVLALLIRFNHRI